MKAYFRCIFLLFTMWTLAQNCPVTSFIKSMGDLESENAKLFEGNNGEYWVTANRNDSIVITKMNANDEAIAARRIKIPNVVMSIEDLFWESDSDLIAIATEEDAFNSVVFRYDWEAEFLVWTKQMDDTYLTQIHSSGTDFIISGKHQINNETFGYFEKLDKATGSISTFQKKELQKGEFQSELDEDILYSSTQRAFSTNSHRVTLSSYNANTGAYIWQYQLVTSGETRMEPTAPIVNETNILVFSTGDLTGFNWYTDGQTEIALTQLSTAGQLLWSKRYIISGISQMEKCRLVQASDGYYMTINAYDPDLGDFGSVVVIKVDFEGNVLWSKTIGGINKNEAQDAWILNDQLYLLINSSYYSPEELLLIKFTQEDLGDSSCAMIEDIFVNIQELPDIRNPFPNSVSDLSIPRQDLSLESFSAGIPESVNYCESYAFYLTETHWGTRCYGASNGGIDLSMNGGVAPFTFEWSDPSIGNVEDPIGLSAGIYEVTVTDVNDCEATLEIEITQPDILALTENHTNIACNSDELGSIDLTVQGGVPPYQYEWSDTSIGNVEDPQDLSLGTYMVTVTDALNCIAELEIQIEEDTDLELLETHTDVYCNEENTGGIDLTIVGGNAPFEYTWSDPSIGNVEDPQNLEAGIYEVTVTDNSGCAVSLSIQIEQIEMDVEVTDFEFCPNEASYFLSAEGSDAYEYIWYDPSNQEIGNGKEIEVDSITNGIYQLEVRDLENGCSKVFYTTVSLNEIPEFLGIQTHENYMEILVPPGRDYLYSVDGGIFQASHVYYFVPYGTHTLSIRNENCQLDVDFEMILVEPIPNVITPNGDGINEYWNLPNLATHYQGGVFSLFNRQGKLLIEKEITQNPVWNGTYLGRKVASDTYWYLIKLPNGETIKGYILVKNSIE